MKVSRVASRANFARFAVVASVLAIVLGCGGGGGKRKPSGGLLITSVAPDSGDVAGGTTVMITGNGFNASTTVSIGGVGLTGITLFDSKTITGVTQSVASPGPVDVVVTNAPLSVTLPGGFTYFEAVTLTSISPNFGPVWGGTGVDIYGTGFVAGTSVTIGGTEMLNLIVVSTSQIQGFSPAGAGGGQVDVAATNQNGADVISNGFEY
ncbi:MAG: IPT/TIG domain-containing protein, partial [Planctomycetota bacterium]|nr:IPT/TIG domain-containing protein [Planctomycetota bacterium]